METPHYGNASISKQGNPSKVVYLSCSEISEKNAEIPQNPVFEREPFYFVAFPEIFDIFFFIYIYSYLYLTNIFEEFPNIFEAFPTNNIATALSENIGYDNVFK